MTPDEATRIVRTETEQELLNEVRTQYERKQQQFKDAGRESLRFEGGI